MTKMRQAAEQLQARSRESLGMGGPGKIERQHPRGKLTVRERIDLLFDPGTFGEYGLLASHLMHKPGNKPTATDGVATGFGRGELQCVRCDRPPRHTVAAHPCPGDGAQSRRKPDRE